jgi:DNA-binding LacI/PurR family transcriptional regulator
MAALRTLADQLGISISTASRALNGYTDVSAATRERVMAAIKRAGRSVGRPDGISVIGYGNTEHGRYADPALTTIDYNIEDNGRHLGQAVLQLLGGTPARQLQRLEPVSLVPRASDSAP